MCIFVFMGCVYVPRRARCLQLLSLEDLLRKRLPPRALVRAEAECAVALQPYLHGDWRLAGHPDVRLRWSPITDAALKCVAVPMRSVVYFWALK